LGENFNRSGATRVNILREVEGSLGRLQTDYIDLYQVHGWDSNTPLEHEFQSVTEYHDIGILVWSIAQAVLRDERIVVPIGSYNADYGVTFSMPSVLGRTGSSRSSNHRCPRTSDARCCSARTDCEMRWQASRRTRTHDELTARHWAACEDDEGKLRANRGIGFEDIIFSHRARGPARHPGAPEPRPVLGPAHLRRPT